MKTKQNCFSRRGFRRSIRLLGAVFAALVLVVPCACPATVYWDSDRGFYPNVTVISPGESVTWVNGDLFGFPVQVTSAAPFGNPNYFLLTLIDFGDAAAVTFNNQGTFGYQSPYAQQGYVVVNIPPVVTITNPANNAVLAAPATFTLQAAASETPDDVVWDVRFLLGTATETNLLGVDQTAPFGLTVTNLTAGTYTLIAIATDYYFGTATNAITITVGSPATISLGNMRFAGGQFLFDASGLTIGKTNVLEVSSTLTTWVPFRTNVAAATSATMTNPPVPGAQFFRLLQRP